MLARRVPAYQAIYSNLGWTMLPALDRVYDNRLARELLGWKPETDFQRALAEVANGSDWRSPMARVIGWKGYHR